MIRAPTFGFQVASRAPLSCDLLLPSPPITFHAIKQLKRPMTTWDRRFLHAISESMPRSMQANLSILVARSKKLPFPALMQAFQTQVRWFAPIILEPSARLLLSLLLQPSSLLGLLGQSFPFPHSISCSLPQALQSAAQTLRSVSAWQPLQPLWQQGVHFTMTLYLV